MKNFSVFVEKFLVGLNIIVRTAVIERKSETLPVFYHFDFTVYNTALLRFASLQRYFKGFNGK